MIDVVGLVAKAAEKTGFVRERADDRRLPTDPSKITVIPFFGDLRTLTVLSAFLLKRFREEDRPSRYVILASYPGFAPLFPYVDEYWGLADGADARKLIVGAAQFRNRESLAVSYARNLNQWFFEDVIVAPDVFGPYYRNGLTDQFWDHYKQAQRFLPDLPSSAVLGSFNRDLQAKGGFKVFVLPMLSAYRWQFGDVQGSPAPREFWLALAARLRADRITPVMCKTWFTHDLSADLPDAVHLAERDVGKILAAMRVTGCVLDVFNTTARLAQAARTPFLAVDERQRYAAVKEYEMDGLYGPAVPRQYIFSFPTIIENTGGWDTGLLDAVSARLNTFLPTLDRDRWPPTGGSVQVMPYDGVRKYKANRLGVRLLKTPRSNREPY